jgi:shikimate dehydrogenase
MHNVAFEELGLNYLYLAFEVEENALGEAVKGLRSLGVCGFNVTIPYKVDVIEYLDELDTTAADVGAVNTVVNKDGWLKGYNTDVQGVVFALKRAGLASPGGLAVILGAGGAARAIAAALATMRCKEILLLNRTEDKAMSLAHEVEKRFGIHCSGLRLTQENLGKVKGAALLVNATSLGMHPKIEESPIPKELIPEGIVVFDVVYNPLRTRFLREAEKRGAKTVSGIDMLIGQGAAAFKLWTGKDAPEDSMRQAAVKALGAVLE